MLTEPQQQCTFCWVAEYGGVVVVGEVELCRGVERHSLAHSRALFVESVQLQAVHTHLVLRQCACLVGAYHCCGPHRLASVHLAYEVVGLEHASHAVRQTQCHRHRQTLGHRNHNQCDGYHERLEHIGDERQPFELLVRG